ncbi:alpha/beta hydrolase [Methylobacterium terrae]|uniref:Alpha/beta hydrolase n=1 Tax=Methylobacterium terrae TaxID=2202827 RepID=A0A2U8WM63_9HYPH|nr:alpha/beta hydrolase [Methylobacterium terrae]AWN47344.1 alpha/beta hydrolase [Methylobacterium terrae]
MFVSVNGVRLFVDVENAGLVPAGDTMREKPTLLLLHGGPGFDHSALKPLFSGLSDVAQVVYYDHRGNGRSEDGERSAWTLAQWGDDVKGLCDALGLVRPIVLGMSWGGYVAQSYATRHPDHPGKLVLVSTAAKFEFPAVFERFGHLGGPEAARIAEAYWTAPTAERRADFIRVCGPLYRRTPSDPEAMRRAVIRHDTALHFNGPENEQGRMDFRSALAGLRCPVLVMAGDHDPVSPIAFSETIVASLPPDRVRFERFAECGHGVFGDAPERASAILRDFIVTGS